MSAIESRSLLLSIRCYRGLLRAYPQTFLAEFEDLLCQAFGDLASRAVQSKGHWGLLVLWMRTIPDLISSVFSQRFRSAAEWSFRLRWILACTAGVALAATLIFGPAFLVFQIKMWLGLLSPHPSHFVHVMPRPQQPTISTNVRILLDAGLIGMLLGLFQSLALTWSRFRRAVWMLATTVGVVLAAGVILLVPVVATYLRVTIHPWRLILDQHESLYYGGATVFCISILGMLQTLVLMRQGTRALTWIPASAVGILVCIPVVMYPPGLPFVGFVYGLLTTLPLEWIFRRRIDERAVAVGSGKLLS